MTNRKTLLKVHYSTKSTFSVKQNIWRTENGNFHLDNEVGIQKQEIIADEIKQQSFCANFDLEETHEEF